MELRAEIKKLIDDFIEAKVEYIRLRFDRDYAAQLGKPCSSEQIAVLEGFLGKPVPPSYRAFLELYNGFESISGNRSLLAVEDQGAGWVQVELENIGDLFEEFGDDNPFEKGAIPVELGQDARGYLVLDPRKVHENGEMDFVKYDFTQEQDRYGDFVSFLRSKVEMMQGLVEDEREGTDEDE